MQPLFLPPTTQLFRNQFLVPSALKSTFVSTAGRRENSRPTGHQEAAVLGAPTRCQKEIAASGERLSLHLLPWPGTPRTPLSLRGRCNPHQVSSQTQQGGRPFPRSAAARRRGMGKASEPSAVFTAAAAICWTTAAPGAAVWAERWQAPWALGDPTLPIATASPRNI